MAIGDVAKTSVTFRMRLTFNILFSWSYMYAIVLDGEAENRAYIRVLGWPLSGPQILGDFYKEQWLRVQTAGPVQGSWKHCRGEVWTEILE